MVTIVEQFVGSTLAADSIPDLVNKQTGFYPLKRKLSGPSNMKQTGFGKHVDSVVLYCVAWMRSQENGDISSQPSLPVKRKFHASGLA